MHFDFPCRPLPTTHYHLPQPFSPTLPPASCFPTEVVRNSLRSRGDNIARARYGAGWKCEDPEKTVEVTWETKRKKNDNVVVRRIKKKTFTFRFVAFERHPTNSSRMLKRIRTYRRTITRKDTAKQPLDHLDGQQQQDATTTTLSTTPADPPSFTPSAPLLLDIKQEAKVKQEAKKEKEDM